MKQILFLILLAVCVHANPAYAENRNDPTAIALVKNDTSSNSNSDSTSVAASTVGDISVVSSPDVDASSDNVIFNNQDIAPIQSAINKQDSSFNDFSRINNSTIALPDIRPGEYTIGEVTAPVPVIALQGLYTDQTGGGGVISGVLPITLGLPGKRHALSNEQAIRVGVADQVHIENTRLLAETARIDAQASLFYAQAEQARANAKESETRTTALGYARSQDYLELQKLREDDNRHRTEIDRLKKLLPPETCAQLPPCSTF